MKKFLILNADDFGLHEAVNEAVEQAHRAGTLTAASLMIGAPAAQDAVMRARRLPTLRVGLHLVMADGRAVLPPGLIPALVGRDGCFTRGMFHDGLRFFAIPAVRRQLESELRAQFEAFARTGLPLDHVNAHKHFQLHPTVMGIILRIGAQFGMRAIRLPAEPLWFAARFAKRRGAADAVLLKPWLGLMRSRLRARQIIYNDQTFGIACSGSFDESTLLEVLHSLPPGVTEVYLHPATRAGSEIAPSMRGYRHTAELTALLSPTILAAISASGARCGGYSDLARLRCSGD